MLEVFAQGTAYQDKMYKSDIDGQKLGNSLMAN